MANFAASIGIGLKKIKMSSVNIKWQIGGQLLDLKMDLIDPSLIRLAIFRLKNSLAIIKRKGDRGSPYVRRSKVTCGFAIDKHRTMRKTNAFFD